MTRTELKTYLNNKKISLNTDNQVDSFYEIEKHLKLIGIYCSDIWDWNSTHVFINNDQSVFRKDQLDDTMNQVYEEISYKDFISKFNELVLSRTEQIAKAASNLYSEFVERNEHFAFIDGAKWADEHPINVWHPVSEEPQGDEWHIAYIDVFGSMQSLKCPSVTFDTFPSLAEFAVGVGMQCWAYISDLLPKQFGISDQLKQDKEKKN